MDDTTNNLPDEGGTGEVMSGDIDIADIFGDDSNDPVLPDNDGDEPADNADDPDEPEGEGEDNSNPDDPDDDGGNSEDPDDEKDGDEEGEGSERVRDSKGRFVSDEYRVKLDDGSTTTIAELKAGALRQGDYTRKTQEVAERSRAVEEREQQYSQREQQLDQQLKQVSWVLEQFQPQLPQASGDMEADAQALALYHQQKAQWDQLNKGWQEELGKRGKSVEEERNRQMAQRVQEAERKVLAAIPQLADPAKMKAFVSEASKVVGDYPLTDETKSLFNVDPGLVLMLRDAMAHRRMKAREPKVKEALAKTPRMNKGRKRANPNSAQRRARQARTDRLKAEQSVEAGVLAIMDID